MRWMRSKTSQNRLHRRRARQRELRSSGRGSKTRISLTSSESLNGRKRRSGSARARSRRASGEKRRHVSRRGCARRPRRRHSELPLLRQKRRRSSLRRSGKKRRNDGSRCSRRSTWTLREWLQRTWLEARRTWGCRTSAGSTLKTSVGASQTLTPKTLTSVVFAVRRVQNCCMRAQMTTGAATSATRSRVSDCICTYLSPLLCFSCLAWLREFTGGLAPRIPHARPRQLSWIY